MLELWAFIKRYTAVFLFLVLELIGFQFLFSRNDYQKAKFLNQNGELQAAVATVQSDIQGFFQLKSENEQLAAENARLRTQTSAMESEHVRIDSASIDTLFHYQAAAVISSPLYSSNKYLTINKGKNHGVKEQDGVLSVHGIVGKVVQVGDNYSLVMPVTHSNFRISVLHVQSSYNGNLSWNGASFEQAQVSDIPRNATINQEEEFVTSQHAKSFPLGSKVGEVQAIDYNLTGSLYQLNINLATDFRKLQHVYICQRKDLNEIIELENEAQ